MGDSDHMHYMHSSSISIDHLFHWYSLNLQANADSQAKIATYETDLEKVRDQLIQANLRIGTLEKCNTVVLESGQIKMENKRLSHEMNVKTKREIDDLQAVLTKTNTG